MRRNCMPLSEFYPQKNASRRNKKSLAEALEGLHKSSIQSYAVLKETILEFRDELINCLLTTSSVRE
jgi:hypothetical protein